MNRLVSGISALCLCGALAASPCAFATKHKKKKNADLSANPLANVNSKQPDKELFDKAMVALNKGKFDIARLDLQTLLNTYPDTEYAMRAKLAVGDTWYKEGGTAALQQAESEYKDFITFFPNSPEAAEAQMKVGDIYYMQMEKPDRDPQNVVHAEQEYRTMLEQYPDSPVAPRAKQRLRDVEEVLAQRQFEVGEYYATRENWAGAIARLQTVVDTYPLFSHSDQTLITLGDAYATEAQAVTHLRMPQKAKDELVKYYDDRAAAAWSRVVTRYPEAPHVEDARDRLIAMGRVVPDPTPEAIAESGAEEGSRTNVKLKDRALLLVHHGPSTIEAARVGEPTLNDPPQTLAPDVNKQTVAVLNAAAKGLPLPEPVSETAPVVAASSGAAAGASGEPTVTSTFESVPDNSGAPGSTVTVEVASPGSGDGAGNGSGNTGGSSAAPADGGAASGDAGTGATTTGNPEINGKPADANGLGNPVVGAPASAPIVSAVGPTNNQPLPPVEKPAEAPVQINDVKNGGAQVTTGTTASGKAAKKKKAPYNKKDESSSKHKQKTGLDKLNPM